MSIQQKPTHGEAAAWEFLYQHNARPHNCRARGFAPGAIETSANLEVIGNAADYIMELFGYDRAQIPEVDE